MAIYITKMRNNSQIRLIVCLVALLFSVCFFCLAKHNDSNLQDTWVSYSYLMGSITSKTNEVVQDTCNAVYVGLKEVKHSNRLTKLQHYKLCLSSNLSLCSSTEIELPNETTDGTITCYRYNIGSTLYLNTNKTNAMLMIMGKIDEHNNLLHTMDTFNEDIRDGYLLGLLLFVGALFCGFIIMNDYEYEVNKLTSIINEKNNMISKEINKINILEQKIFELKNKSTTLPKQDIDK